MNKALSAALVIACVGGGYTAASWYFGKQTEVTLDKQYTRVLEKLPNLKIIERDYQRGLFTSQENLTLEISREPSDVTDNAESFRLVIHSDIRHGPMPGFSAFATASTTMDIKLADDVAAELSEQLVGKSLLTQQTLIRFDGSGAATFNSPPLALSVPDVTREETGKSVSLDWQGMSGVLDFSPDMENLRFKALSPALSLISEAGDRVRISDIQVSGDQQRLYPDIDSLYSGSQKMLIGEVSIDTSKYAQKPFVMKQLAYDVDLVKEGEFLNAIERFGMQNILVDAYSFGPMHFDVSFRHLHGRTFAEFSKALMAINSELSKLASDQPASDESLMPVLKLHGQHLLDYNPEIHIDRISFATGDGEVELTGQVRLNELNLDAAMENPFMVLASLVANGELSLDENMILELFRNPPKSELLGNTDEEGAAALAANAQMLTEQFQQQVAMFTDMGYITREGSLLKTKVTFEAGELLVNGQPFMPMAQPAQMEDETGDMEADPSLMEEDTASVEVDSVLEEVDSILMGVDPALMEEQTTDMEAGTNLQ